MLATLAMMLAAPAAFADKVPRAEMGKVRLVLADATPQNKAVVLKPGELAWDELVRPADTVRLLDEAPVRIRPNKTDGAPAGAVLFGYQLSSGVAYCAPGDVSKMDRSVQCFRDFDADGKFDGGYVTRETSVDTRYFSSLVHGLTAVTKIRYEPAASGDLPAARMRVVYKGLKKQSPRFDVYVEDAKLEKPIDCAVSEAGVCELLGRSVAFTTQADGAIQLTVLDIAPNRTMALYDPNKLLEP